MLTTSPKNQTYCYQIISLCSDVIGRHPLGCEDDEMAARWVGGRHTRGQCATDSERRGRPFVGAALEHQGRG